MSAALEHVQEIFEQMNKKLPPSESKDSKGLTGC